jgi:rod shape determining protein RodA
MLVVLSLFVFIFYKMLIYLKTSNNIFENLVVAGVAIMFFVQMTINIGMNIGLLPVTGVPLPLLSFGGSHIVVDCLALGVVHRIIRQG